MRLRYLHLQNYPPIANIKVCFASGSPLARDCAIRFVVGVNGSGKSNLLRAVAEVFLALADLRVPAFPVSLVYELGVRGSPSHRTLLLHSPGDRQQATLWLHERFQFDDGNGQEVFEACIEHLAMKGMPSVPGFMALIDRGRWPQRDSTPPQIALPSTVLAYTTGDLRPWRSVWSRNQNAEGLQRSADDGDREERPAGWTAAQERALVAARPTFEATRDDDRRASTVEAESFRRPLLLDATLLKCALLAVALPQAFVETTDYPGRAEVDAAMAQLQRRSDNKTGLQDLLGRGGWHHLVSVAFRSRLQASQWDQKLCETAHDWWQCASEVIAEPHPTEARRTLFFDLKGAFDAHSPSFISAARDELQTCTTHGEALWGLLGGAQDASAFELFTRLIELNQVGLFDDVLIRLRRAPLPNEREVAETDDIGVLRYEELSDGEQMVLGRMALFHLLQGQQDALLLLDEPETHFNDKWKREIVDIIDDAIGHTSNDVLISTHSAIVLSDVFNNEIVMVQKTANGSIVRSVDEPTFATDPRAILEALETELQSSKSPTLLLTEKLTIEHVMPQTWQTHWPLPAAAKADPLAEQKARAARDVALNTLGNLTLITGSFNSSLQNAAWADKKPELLKYSKLNLTQYFHESQANVWDEAAIDSRTQYLFEKLLKIWPEPFKTPG